MYVMSYIWDSEPVCLSRTFSVPISIDGSWSLSRYSIMLSMLASLEETARCAINNFRLGKILTSREILRGLNIFSSNRITQGPLILSRSHINRQNDKISQIWRLIINSFFTSSIFFVSKFVYIFFVSKIFWQIFFCLQNFRQKILLVNISFISFQYLS